MPSKFVRIALLSYNRLLPAYLFGAAVIGWTSCHGFAKVGGVRTAQTLNRGPRQSLAKRVWWGEEEQGSGCSFCRQAEAEPSGLCDDEDDALASIDDFVAGKLN